MTDRRDQHHTWARRDLLRGGGAASLGLVALSGCDLLSTDPTSGNGKQRGHDDRGSASKAKEAPTLAKQVKAGKLPPLDKRLPKNPLTLQPVDSIGQYGGTWHTASTGPSDNAWAYRVLGYDQLLSWDLEFTKTVPNIATSVKPNADGSEWTIVLRQGMKWSDGEPFTADDVVFAIEDDYKNTEINPATPQWLTANDKPATAKKVNDHTVVLTYPGPKGLLGERLATSDTTGLVVKPKHYLKQFHKKYNPDVDELVKKSNASGWVQLYQRKGAQMQGAPASAEWMNADLPVLNAWRLVQPYGEGNRMIAERNPYYWKVDPDGRQLPYIDRVVFQIVTDEQTILLKATHGDFDYHARHVMIPQNKPVLARNRDKGNYHFVAEVPSSMNQMIVAFNLAHKDPAMREMFQNKDFRIGLSYAINRKELIDAAFQRQGKPWQAAPKKESEFYLDGFGQQYTEHDLDKANHHLDKAGYDKRDSSGNRLGADGQPIRFHVELPSEYQPSWPDALQIIKSYWKKVGVQISAKPEERSLFYQRKANGIPDATIWGGDGGLHDAILDPRWYFPFSQESNYADPWANWYNDDHSHRSTKPPAPVRHQMELYDQVKATAEKNDRQKLFMQILKIAMDQFWVIGTALPGPGYAIVKNNFHNVPKSMPSAWQYPNPGPSQPAQFWMET